MTQSNAPVGSAAIPTIGFGTYQITDDSLPELVVSALRYGYRHIDTARIYENETLVGEGLKRAGDDRDDYFLTTKIWPEDFSSSRFRRATEASLKRLGVDHVDLLLLHWPNPDVPLEETIDALNQVRVDGLTRHIGVSNFNIDLLKQAVELSDAPIVVNQIELHPYLDQSALLHQMRLLDVTVQAYCPIARAEVVGDPVLRGIGERYGKSEAQVTLRWLIQQGIVALPKTATPRRIGENIDVFDFELSDAEMIAVARRTGENRRLVDPDFAPAWD